jgi:hypothetical protein
MRKSLGLRSGPRQTKRRGGAESSASFRAKTKGWGATIQPRQLSHSLIMPRAIDLQIYNLQIYNSLPSNHLNLL